MASFLGELVIKITGDSADIRKDIEKTEKGLKKFGDNATKVGKTLTASITLPVLGIGVAMLKAASDAEETASKFDTVFKDVNATAQESAKELSDSFGLSTDKSKELLASTGDLLTGFGFTGAEALNMSEEVNKLAVDLASFTNFSGGAEGASAALTKALLGERESIKSLGISIQEADIKQFAKEQLGLTGVLTRQQKAAITLQLAYKQSKNAIGDFARTSDSLANQARILKADTENLAVTFGTLLIPVAKDVISVVGELIEWFQDLTEGQKQAIITVAGLAAAIGPLTVAIGALSANPIIAVGVALVVAHTASIALNESFANSQGPEIFTKLVGRGDDLVKSLKKTGDAYGKNEEQMGKILLASDDITDSQKEQIESYLKTVPLLKEINKNSDDLEKSIENVAKQTGLSRVEIAKMLAGEKNLSNEKTIQLVQYAKIRDSQAAITDEVLKQFTITRTARSNAENAFKERQQLQQQLQQENQTSFQESINQALIEKQNNLSIAESQDIIAKKTGDKFDLVKAKIDATKGTIDELLAVGVSGESPLVSGLVDELVALGEQQELQIERNTRVQESLSSLGGEYSTLIANKSQYSQETQNQIANLEDLFEQITILTEEGLPLENEQVAALVEQYERLGDEIEETGRTSVESAKIRTTSMNQAFKATSSITNSISQIFANANKRKLQDDTLSDEKRKELQRKQAKRQKALAIFGAVVDGTQAVINAFGTQPVVPLGLIMGVLMTGIVAAQIAAIASQPLPALADGGLVLPKVGGQQVIMGEAGVPEFAVPERPDVLARLAEGIQANAPEQEESATLGGGAGVPTRYILEVEGTQMSAFITEAARDRNILIDRGALV